MTVEKQRKILERIREIESQITAVREARLKIATNPYSSASIGSGSGSKSYSVKSTTDCDNCIRELTRELSQLRRMLANAGPLKEIVHIYC